MTTAAAARPLRLHWFSPLLPLATDIGHFTGRVLPALTRCAEVTLWTTQETWDESLEALCPVRRWSPQSPDWAALNACDVAVYNIGNNAGFHADILWLARRMPGLVMLHDTRLQHLMRAVLDGPDYSREMERLYGPEVRPVLDDLQESRVTVADIADRYPLTDLATETALGVLLHNAAEARALARRTEARVLALPLPFPPGPPPEPPKREGPVRLIQFGYIGRNRRIESILDALAALPAEERDGFRLDIYGKPWDEAALTAKIARCGLTGIVTLHGFVTESELDAAIARAELAFNLRWPSMGEASGSQLRLWAAGRPALVTNTGWYASLPRGTVIPVSPEVEAVSITHHLRCLRDDPAPYRAVGEAGRAHLEAAHDPADYAPALVEAARVMLADGVGPARLLGARLGTAVAALPREARPAVDMTRLAGLLTTPCGATEAPA